MILFFRLSGLVVALCFRLACPVDRVPALRLITRRQIRPTITANNQHLNLRKLVFVPQVAEWQSQTLGPTVALES